MSENRNIIPVWFFVGLLLLIYGALIFFSGLAEWRNPPPTVLADLQSSLRPLGPARLPRGRRQSS